MRDPALSVLSGLVAALLVLGALAAQGTIHAEASSTGAAAGVLRLLPTSPAALASCVLLLVAVFVACVLPTRRDARPGAALPDTVGALVLCAPAAAALHVAGGPFLVPWGIVAFAAALGLLAGAARPRSSGADPRPASNAAHRGMLALGVAILGGGPALDAAGLVAWPPFLHAPTAPLSLRPADHGTSRVAPADLVPSPWAEASAPGALPRRAARWAAAPAAGPLAATWRGGPLPGASARWLAVPTGAAVDAPDAGPVVLVLDASDVPPLPSAVRVLAWPRDRRGPASDPRDLDAIDVVVLPPRPRDRVEDDGLAPTLADLLVGFVRRGGLLVGPPSTQPWPALLARRFGGEAPIEAGPAGVRAFGAGHLARADATEDLDALLAAGAHRPRLATVFDRATSAPPPPSAAGPLGDRRTWPREASGAAPTLWVAAAVTAVLGLAAFWFVSRRVLVLAFLSAIATVPLLGFDAARRPDFAAQTLVFECAGAGGPRVEATWIEAGARGWVGPPGPGPRGDVALRTLGLRFVRDETGVRWALPPYGGGWLVVEAVAADPGGDLQPVEGLPSWAAGYVVRGGRDALVGRSLATQGPGAPDLDGLASAGLLRWAGVTPDRVRRVHVRLR